jgi:hypothetical protein
MRKEQAHPAHQEHQREDIRGGSQAINGPPPPVHRLPPCHSWPRHLLVCPLPAPMHAHSPVSEVILPETSPPRRHSDHTTLLTPHLVGPPRATTPGDQTQRSHHYCLGGNGSPAILSLITTHVPSPPTQATPSQLTAIPLSPEPITSRTPHLPQRRHKPTPIHTQTVNIAGHRPSPTSAFC